MRRTPELVGLYGRSLVLASFNDSLIDNNKLYYLSRKSSKITMFAIFELLIKVSQIKSTSKQTFQVLKLAICYKT